MSIAIPEKILRRIVADLRSGLEPEKTDDLCGTDALQRRWMAEGLKFLEGRIKYLGNSSEKCPQTEGRVPDEVGDEECDAEQRSLPKI